MRTIKFRGKTVLGNWVYGDLLHNRGETFIVPDEIANPLATADDFKVDQQTVGQFTGLLDKNGSEIYEGDKLLIQGNATAVVVWRNEGFDILDTCSWTQTDKGEVEGFVYVPIKSTMHIIGNIHDNPELLTNK